MSELNILNTRILDNQNKYLYSVLKYKNSIPRVVGTSSLESQNYPADIDMLCLLDFKPMGFNEVQRQFKIIFNRIKSNGKLFFIEFKLQNMDKNSKFKFYNLEDINGPFFKDNYDSDKIDLCKIDLLQFNQGVFQEISCIYFFNKIQNQEEFQKSYINELLDDQKEKYDDGKYYKSLKRFMVASTLQSPPNTNLIIGITNFFNSQTGKVYQLSNFLMACQIYIDKFGIDDRVHMFLNNIGLKGYDPKKIDDIIKDYEKLYNSEALKFYKHFKIPVGELAKFQKDRLNN
jgi:hypothetical protein